MITCDIVKHTKLMNLYSLSFIYDTEYHCFVTFGNDMFCKILLYNQFLQDWIAFCTNIKEHSKMIR